jgi:hypothetical protein
MQLVRWPKVAFLCELKQAVPYEECYGAAFAEGFQ